MVLNEMEARLLSSEAFECGESQRRDNDDDDDDGRGTAVVKEF
jgi:hypothetical protein